MSLLTKSAIKRDKQNLLNLSHLVIPEIDEEINQFLNRYKYKEFNNDFVTNISL